MSQVQILPVTLPAGGEGAQAVKYTYILCAPTKSGRHSKKMLMQDLQCIHCLNLEVAFSRSGHFFKEKRSEVQHTCSSEAHGLERCMG